MDLYFSLDLDWRSSLPSTDAASKLKSYSPI